MKPNDRSAARAMLALSTTLLASSMAYAAAHKPLSHGSKPDASQIVAGNAANGARLYQVCTGCHSIDANDVGPKHRGVVGRKAGSVPGYAYSAALHSSGIVWTPVNLNKWLTGPQKMIPGAKMYFSVAKAQDRADIIAYLATQK